jgi:hypothetical protein
MEKTSDDQLFRIIVALSIGAVAGFACLAHMKTLPNGGADDFTWHWLGARALLEGQSPYEVVTAGGKYNLIAPYIYPLTTAVAALPFAAFLPPASAAALFMGVSSALLAWGLSSEGYQRFPLFMSVPYIWALTAGQFSPVITAGALLASVAWIAPIKPTIGLAAVAFRPSKWTVIGCLAFVLLGFLFNPRWVFEWRAALPHRVPDVYWSPATVVGGPLLLLAILRYKRPEARLLFTLALVPQLFLFYDQLLLWLIPRDWKESSVLSALSWLALYFGNKGFGANATTHDVVTAYSQPIMLLLFLPSLAMVLMRRNEGRSLRLEWMR